MLLVSADPAADTPARVARFLAGTSLSGRVSYLSGSPAQLRPVWHAFHITPARADRAAFARTASVFLIDRTGHERVIFQLEQLTPEGLAHDIRKLLAPTEPLRRSREQRERRRPRAGSRTRDLSRPADTLARR